MAIKHLVRFLYTRVLGATDPEGAQSIHSLANFAAKYDVTRQTLANWMAGTQRPRLGQIRDLIENEGYTLDDCLEIPAREREGIHGQYADLFRDLEAFLLHETDKATIAGIRNLLSQAAEAATTKTQKRKQKESRGKLVRHVKKKNEAG